MFNIVAVIGIVAAVTTVVTVGNTVNGLVEE